MGGFDFFFASIFVWFLRAPQTLAYTRKCNFRNMVRAGVVSCARVESAGVMCLRVLCACGVPVDVMFAGCVCLRVCLRLPVGVMCLRFKTVLSWCVSCGSLSVGVSEVNDKGFF